MGVNRDRRLAERGVEDDIGGFAPDAGKALQRLARPGHLTAMLLHQPLARCSKVLRLRSVEPDVPDVALDSLAPQLDHFSRRVGGREQSWCREIYALVSRLCREHDRDQQLERGLERELGARGWVCRQEALEQALNVTGFHVAA